MELTCTTRFRHGYSHALAVAAAVIYMAYLEEPLLSLLKTKPVARIFKGGAPLACCCDIPLRGGGGGLEACQKSNESSCK